MTNSWGQSVKKRSLQARKVPYNSSWSFSLARRKLSCHSCLDCFVLIKAAELLTGGQLSGPDCGQAVFTGPQGTLQQQSGLFLGARILMMSLLFVLFCVDRGGWVAHRWQIRGARPWTSAPSPTAKPLSGSILSLCWTLPRGPLTAKSESVLPCRWKALYGESLQIRILPGSL